MPAPLRDVPAAAVDLIKSFEGIPDGDPATVRIDAYLCPAGVWTIGWAHAIVDGGVQLKGAETKARTQVLCLGGVTRSKAEALLRSDLIRRAAPVSRSRSAPAVLPVPVPAVPAEDRAAAKKAAPKPRARTTTPKAPPPPRKAARKAPQTAR